MTGNPDFDQTLQAWLHRQAPREAPDRVLAAALERVAAEEQRRPWPQRLLGRTTITTMLRAAAFAAAVVLAAVIGLQFADLTIDVGPSPSPSPSAAPSPSPSAAPSPSASTAPRPAALVMQLLGGGESGLLHLVTILDDGRVITSDPNGAEAPQARRLTTAGIQLVRDEVNSTGLAERTANYWPVPNPGIEPPGFGGAGPRLEIHQPEGSSVVISWYLFADTPEDFFQPQPEAEALEALLVRLSTLEAWLPSAAWADASAMPYVPDGYRMTIEGSPWGGGVDSLPADVASVSWPVDLDLPGLQEAVDSTGDETQCSVVEAASGTAVIEAMQAAGATPLAGTYLSFWLGVPATSRVITITLAPILPFDAATC